MSQLGGPARRDAGQAAIPQGSPHGARGFTLIELVVSVLIVGLLAAIAIPTFLGSRERANSADCLVARGYAERANRVHALLHGRPAMDFEPLVDEHLIDDMPSCPSGGTYSWSEVDGVPVLHCSVHAPGGSQTPLSPLGSTFTEISAGFIKLIDDYYATHGRYPRSWGDYRYTDIGLDLTDWGAAIDHVLYQPTGNRLQVKPEPGFVMEVTSLSGTTLTLTSGTNWNLVYDNARGQWFFKSNTAGNEIDISTLVIRPG